MNSVRELTAEIGGVFAVQGDLERPVVDDAAERTDGIDGEDTLWDGGGRLPDCRGE